jgi:signal transduction histidine kinase
LTLKQKNCIEPMPAVPASLKSLWFKGLITLLVYLFTAVLSLTWPSSVAGVSHLYLATGVGLACLMAWGRAMAWVVGLGSALVVVGWTLWYMPETLSWQNTGLLCLASGIGAGLQAWLGTVLTQGANSTQAMPLDSVKSITRFYLLAGVLACTINASLCTATMVYQGTIPATAAFTVGGTWWAGDTVGVLLGAPMMLTLIGAPQSLWRQRRRVVGIPLMIATVLMGWGVGLVQQWEHEKAVLEFRRQAEATAAVLRAQMHGYLDTLETLRGLFNASESVTREEFKRAGAYWLNNQPGVMALGWSQRINADQLTVFEQQTRQEGLRQFEVFDLPGHARTRQDALVVRFIEPMAPNHQALGYNMLSNATARQAFEQSVLGDAPVSTLPLHVWAGNAASTTTRAPGVVVFRSVPVFPDEDTRNPPQPPKGAVFVALQLEQTLQLMMQQAPTFMHACLQDVTEGKWRVLAGGTACTGQTKGVPKQDNQDSAFGQHSFVHEVMLPNFGQRQWAVTLWADRDTALGAWTPMSAMFGLGGVALAAALGCLLLVVTGHTARLNAAMTDARRQRAAAEEASNAKSEFLSRMSHELRTPLNAMLGFAQVMELDPASRLNDAQQARLDQIQQAGWHLLDMIDDVLDISSIDTGAMPLQKGPIDVDAALTTALATVEALRQKHDVNISVKSLLTARWGALADATRLQQVLSNLLSNAVKYNKPGGHVQVLASVVHQALNPEDASAGTQAMVVLTVTDSGQGMTHEQLEQLFQPFNRLGRARGAAAGMGIGLVISRHLTQLMGGTLDATSKLGDGSVFTLVLPAAAIPLPEQHPTTTASADPNLPPALPGQKYVLYVEDNVVNSTVMQALMRERPHIHLAISGTIEDGLASLHDRTRGPKPDLILLDVHLPDASGLDLLNLLKANPDTQDIPVVMISADAMPEQIDACLKAGAACYLTKPIQIRVLLQQIDDLLA